MFSKLNLLKVFLLFVLPIFFITFILVFWLSDFRDAPEGDIFENSEADITEEILDKEGGETEPVIFLSNLNIPWDIEFLPNGDVFVTERAGNLILFSGDEKKEISIAGVEHSGEGGLLGIALHPEFSSNRYLYLYLTSKRGDGLVNKVTRFKFENDKLTEPLTIIDGIPGAPFHDGGRIAFNSERNQVSGREEYFLYITTGDAGETRLAQDRTSLAGKILRIKDDGATPEDNPFGNAVWSYGHRNPQGIAWDEEGRLWATEHGRSGVLSGFDEINLIVRAGNYGWPESQGDSVISGTKAPALHSGPSNTWAPASASYSSSRRSLFFGGLRGQALYEAVLEGEKVIELKEHFKGEFGRIRTVKLGPDNMIYLTTSNKDGRGRVGEDDDKIIKINPSLLE